MSTLSIGLAATACGLEPINQERQEDTSEQAAPYSESGSDSAATEPLPAYCNPARIFEMSCSTGVCHERENGERPEGSTDLFTEGLAQRLLDVPAEYPGVDGCPDEPELLINTADFEQSLMWKKLNNTQDCGEGMPIPYGVAPLDDDDISCISAWMRHLIEDGR